MTYNINVNESSQKKIIVEALKTMICNNNPGECKLNCVKLQ